MSKLNTYYYFKENLTPTPKTYFIPKKKKQLDYEFILQKFILLKKPVVIKPEDGVGAEYIFYFESESQLKRFFLNYPHKIENRRNFILQEFVEGKDLSASLIGFPCTKDSDLKDPLLLSINSQNIDIKNSNHESEYFGGTTPIESYNKVKNNLNHILGKTNFTGIKGYFGVDFIWSPHSKLYFIEINPRLTTSYIGLRNVINYNPAKLILDSILHNFNDYEIKHIHNSIFSRIEMDYNEKLQNEEIDEDLLLKFVREIPEIVTPPISFNKSNHFTCFIATKSKNISESKERLNDIKKILNRFGFENIK
jgi:predicted ATP-grasp superfamily ATP-dependent carboligase